MLFKEPPTIPFYPEVTDCPECGLSLCVLKTKERKVTTLHIGQVQVHETVLHCRDCGGVYGSEKLAELVAPGCNFGHDIVVAAGENRLQNMRSVEETCEEFRQQNIEISDRQIKELVSRFAVSLGMVHLEAAPEISEHLKSNGGYILHIDSTSKMGSRKLLSGIDEISGFVLLSVSLKNETADQIAEFINTNIKRFGRPLAIASDMAKSISCALTTNEELADIPHYICHMHFLRDCGKDIMEESYQQFCKYFDQHKITAKLKIQLQNMPPLSELEHTRLNELIDNLALPENQAVVPDLQAETLLRFILDNILENEKSTYGCGFPFDRPKYAFYQHILEAEQVIEKLRKSPRIPDQLKKKVNRIHQLLATLKNDRKLTAAAKKLESRIDTFETLREHLRLTTEDKPNTLNLSGIQPEDNIYTIEEAVRKFRDELDLTIPVNIKLQEQLDRHWHGLFRPPITITTTDQAPIIIHPQRTNNILEQFFRTINHSERRRTGTQYSAARLDAALPDTLLVRNLRDPKYLKMILGSSPNLAHRFSQLDHESVKETLKNAVNHSTYNKPRKARQVMKSARNFIKLAIDILKRDIRHL